jgi:SAM-dependent methyltransferase
MFARRAGWRGSLARTACVVCHPGVVRSPTKLRGRELITGGLRYFDYQRAVGERVVVPWIGGRIPIEGLRVGDFGAHAGGILDAFRAAGAESGVGFEINAEIVRQSPFREDENFKLEVTDLTQLDSPAQPFDLVVLHDVLEHIPDTSSVLDVARRSLAAEGRIFVSFPPYYSMVGGHQHLAQGWVRLAPWIHYLPDELFFRVARPGDNEYMSEQDSLDDMVSVRRTRLTLRKAERSFAAAGLAVDDTELFVSRPEYTVRYGWPTIRANPLRRIPLVGEALLNGAFYLLATR